MQYSVLYSKDAAGKKRKTFHDGRLSVSHQQQGLQLILFNDDGVELRKTSIKILNGDLVGKELMVGQYLVQIEAINEQWQPSASSSSTTNTGISSSRSVFTATEQSDIATKRTKTLGRFRMPSTTLPPAKNLSVNGPPHTTSNAKSFSADETADVPFWCEDHVNNDTIEYATKCHTTATAEVIASAAARGGDDDAMPQRIATSRMTSSRPVTLDPCLLRIMRPHQVEGAEFLLQRLFPFTADTDTTDSHINGAILADEMGLGKTLTSISVIWSAIRSESCKVLVISPSSLVKNWIKEFKHWLGTKINLLSLQAGSDAGAVINTFTISPTTRYPVMILSYEMFRKYAASFNKVPKLNFVVCDEGHRLKSTTGSKTMDAFEQCKAQKRLVLSGTPIQNDLEELFVLVSFVAPGLLGTRAEFKRHFASPILRGKEIEAMAALQQQKEQYIEELHQSIEVSTELMSKLKTVVLRRTQDEILRHLLPKRTDVILYCNLTKAQKLAYDTCCQKVLRFVILTPRHHLHIFHDRLPSMKKPRPSLSECNDDESDDEQREWSSDEEWDEADESNDNEKGTASIFKSSTHHADKITSKGTEDPSIYQSGDYDAVDIYAADDDDVDSNVASNIVLPALQQLRRICNTAQQYPERIRLDGGKRSMLQNRFSHSIENCEPNAGIIGNMELQPIFQYDNSVKLQVLASLLYHIRHQSPKERVVVVSNFTKTLDAVMAMAESRGFGPCLRLDGSVPTERRQSLIDQFNKSLPIKSSASECGKSPPFLFLLSAKAGGVGINLIGASRLVMFDVDWNPAVDKQAMSRIWREGQIRPVFIYRLVAAGTIEEAILQRQRGKSTLATLIDVETAATNQRGKGTSGLGLANLSRKELNLLLYPPSIERTDSKIGCINFVEHDTKQQQPVSTKNVEDDGHNNNYDVNDDCVLCATIDQLSKL